MRFCTTYPHPPAVIPAKAGTQLRGEGFALVRYACADGDMGPCFRRDDTEYGALPKYQQQA